MTDYRSVDVLLESVEELASRELASILNHGRPPAPEIWTREELDAEVRTRTKTKNRTE